MPSFLAGSALSQTSDSLEKDTIVRKDRKMEEIIMKKIVSLLLVLALALALAACGGQKEPAATEAPETAASEQDTADAAETETNAETEASDTEAPQADAVDVNLYVLSGPTGIGAVNLRAKAEAGEALSNNYHVTMTGANDEVVAAVSNGQADIACVATNLASVLYNKTEGGVKVLAVNTLGVLSILTNAAELDSIADLAGKTIYSPGQGANPEYILRYVLQGNGLDPDQDVTIQFVSEGSELTGVWETDPEAVIMAPQPVATALLMQNEGASKAFDMTEEWNQVSGGESTLMMGCVIVRTAFLEEHPEAVEGFLTDYAASIEAAQNDLEGTAALCEQYGIIPKAALAMKAIPQCGLTFVSGEEMKAQLGGYLSVMFDAEPKSVGGKLPGDDFYYGN